jgi:hypothetical protein
VVCERELHVVMMCGLVKTQLEEQRWVEVLVAAPFVIAVVEGQLVLFYLPS